MANLSCCARLFIFIFAIFNVIFTLIGLAALAVGIYLVVLSPSYQLSIDNDYIAGAALLITAGVVTVLVAVVGCVGAVFKWRPLLAVYAIVLTIIIILEIIGGAVSYYYRDTLSEQSEDEFTERLTTFISNYRVTEAPDFQEETNTAVDLLQRNLECCGVYSPSDWGTINGEYIQENFQELPRSCDCTLGDEHCARLAIDYFINNTFIGTTNGTVWTEGCFNRTVEVSVFIAAVSGGVGIAFGVVEVLGIVIAIALICCITGAKQEVV